MPHYKTWNTGTRNTDETPEQWRNNGILANHRNTGGTTEYWRNNGILVEQSEYHGIVEHVESSGTTQKQGNTKKFKTRKLF